VKNASPTPREASIIRDANVPFQQKIAFLFFPSLNCTTATARPFQEQSAVTVLVLQALIAVTTHTKPAKNNADKRMLIATNKKREESASPLQTAAAKLSPTINAQSLQIQRAAMLPNLMHARRDALLEPSATLSLARMLE
jgi:hypothetical protein